MEVRYDTEPCDTGGFTVRTNITLNEDLHLESEECALLGLEARGSLLELIESLWVIAAEMKEVHGACCGVSS